MTIEDDHLPIRCAVARTVVDNWAIRTFGKDEQVQAALDHACPTPDGATHEQLLDLVGRCPLADAIDGLLYEAWCEDEAAEREAAEQAVRWRSRLEARLRSLVFWRS